ncbi:MAG: DUF2085 domain-containing protein [Flexilinea sp.]|nr:DUF2085 domain-containing protein [Flexilinea sp.]
MAPIDKKIRPAILAAVSGVILFIILCLCLNTPPDRLIGAAFCHQLPSRSPAPDFPFCFRCAGMFSGILWSILFSYLSERRGKLFEKRLITAFAAAFLLFMLDIINTTGYIPIRLYEEREEIRFLSSFPLGYMLVRLMAGIWLYFFDGFKIKEILRTSYSLPFLLVTSAVSFLIIFHGTAFLLHGFGYFLAVGSLFFLLILYSILIRCVAILKNRSYPDRMILLSALFIVFIQIGLLGGLHIRFLPSEVFDRTQ